jgi:uncharacterized protein (TIGR02466 family)
VLQLNNGGLFLFPPEIYKFKYEFNKEVLLPKIQNLFGQVDENSKLEYGDALSTVSVNENLQPHTWDELANFQNWLGGKIADIRREHRFSYTYSEVTRSWFNRHMNGGLTVEHNHNNATFVVASYIKLPPNSGFIQFKDPLEYHKNLFPIHPEETLYRTLPCEENDVLIFPGYLKHRVEPNNTDQERIVMTFNIK